jgi:hypothetical protein
VAVGLTLPWRLAAGGSQHSSKLPYNAQLKHQFPWFEFARFGIYHIKIIKIKYRISTPPLRFALNLKNCQCQI